MTGKHDKAADGETPANLLYTGPIVIRGLGRGMRDALKPSRPSRHRAFRGDPDEVPRAAASPAGLGSATPAIDDGASAGSGPEEIAGTERVGDGPASDVSSREEQQDTAAEPAMQGDGAADPHGRGEDPPQEDDEPESPAPSDIPREPSADERPADASAFPDHEPPAVAGADLDVPPDDRSAGGGDLAVVDEDRPVLDEGRLVGDEDRPVGGKDPAGGDEDGPIGGEERLVGEEDRPPGDQDRAAGDEDRSGGDEDHAASDRDPAVGAEDLAIGDEHPAVVEGNGPVFEEDRAVADEDDSAVRRTGGLAMESDTGTGPEAAHLSDDGSRGDLPTEGEGESTDHPDAHAEDVASITDAGHVGTVEPDSAQDESTVRTSRIADSDLGTDADRGPDPATERDPQSDSGSFSDDGIGTEAEPGGDPTPREDELAAAAVEPSTADADAASLQGASDQPGGRPVDVDAPHAEERQPEPGEDGADADGPEPDSAHPDDAGADGASVDDADADGAEFDGTHPDRADADGGAGADGADPDDADADDADADDADADDADADDADADDADADDADADDANAADAETGPAEPPLARADEHLPQAGTGVQRSDGADDTEVATPAEEGGSIDPLAEPTDDPDQNVDTLTTAERFLQGDGREVHPLAQDEESGPAPSHDAAEQATDTAASSGQAPEEVPASGDPEGIRDEAGGAAQDGPGSSDADIRAAYDRDANTLMAWFIDRAHRPPTRSEELADPSHDAAPPVGAASDHSVAADPPRVEESSPLLASAASAPPSRPKATAGPATAARAAGPAAAATRRPSARRRALRTALRNRVGREAIGIAVLAVLALICAALITAVVVKTRDDADRAAREAAAYTPPPLAAPSSAPTPRAGGTASPKPGATAAGTVAVIGDETATRAAGGVGAAERWPQLVATAARVRLVPLPVAGGGYAAKNDANRTFGDVVDDVPTNADVVLVVGGAADRDVAPLSLARAASDTIAQVQSRAPDARVVVVGPVVADGTPDATLDQIRAALRTAATARKATWADPVADAWIRSDTADAPADLTAAQERTIADRMGALVERALD